MSKEISYANAMIGLTIVGGYANHIVGILKDDFKFEISLGLFNTHNGRLPSSEEEMYADEQTVEAYERLKRFLQLSAQHAFNALARQDAKNEKRERQQQAYTTRKNFNSMHKQAPEGTVDELAKKYGVSKSHIRNLKRENRLHELTETQPQS